MLTVKQIRDVFYSLWNNTVSLGRIGTAEANIVKLENKCILLKLEDESIHKKLDSHVERLQQLIADAQAFSQNLKSDSEKRFADFWNKNQLNVESIRKLNKQIEEHKHFQDMMINKTESIASRLSKTKDLLMEELKLNKSELGLKIEETDKFFNEQVEILQSSIERNKVTAKEQLSRTKDNFQKSLITESTELKAFIAKTRVEIKEQSDIEKAKYEEKLKKIKEVCAQFFNKYDKLLTGYDDQIHELDKRIEDWAKLLVKPQEVNQARLFAIDTRLKETEDFRVREAGFMKDIFRKLIYALEQTEVQKSVESQNNYGSPSNALVTFEKASIP